MQGLIASNVRNTLATIKQPNSNKELFFKNAVLQMMLNSKENVSITKILRVLKVNRCTLFKAKSQHVNSQLFSLGWLHVTSNTAVA